MNILVIANEIVDDSLDIDGARVCVVAPALNSRLRHWLSDVDASLRNAEDRLAHSLVNLGAARGWVGDADPVQAVADALCFFAADAIAVVGDGTGSPAISRAGSAPASSFRCIKPGSRGSRARGRRRECSSRRSRAAAPSSAGPARRPSRTRRSRTRPLWRDPARRR